MRRFQLPLLGSNQDSPDPESGVLPVTPRGRECGKKLTREPRPDNYPPPPTLPDPNPKPCLRFRGQSWALEYGVGRGYRGSSAGKSRDSSLRSE